MGPSRARALLEFLEANLVERLYKPIIQGEVEKQMRRQEDEDRELTRVQEDVTALERHVEERRKIVDEKRNKLEEL